MVYECDCGGIMERWNTTWKGIEVDGWRCVECGEGMIEPKDAQRALEEHRRVKKNDKDKDE